MLVAFNRNILGIVVLAEGGFNRAGPGDATLKEHVRFLFQQAEKRIRPSA